MSFTAEIKDELSRLEPECIDCRKAQLSALLHMMGKLSAYYRIEITTDTAPAARSVVKLVHGVYKLKTEITTRRSVLHGANNYLVALPPQPGLEETLRDLGVIHDRGLDFGVDDWLVRKPCCLASYLRGAFLGAGFVADPQGNFHFELSCGHEQMANDLALLMERAGIPARVTTRRNSWVVYLKDADSIVDFLALTGAHRAVLEMENVRVTKSVRNDINRRLNAEIANQARSVNAGIDQCEMIGRIARMRGLSSLPPALEEVARLRLGYPDASLRELGEKAVPPLSKSAVNHRMRRLEEMAREL